MKKLLIMVLLSLLPACNLEKGDFHEVIQGSSKKIVLIEFYFPVGSDGNAKFTDQREIGILLDWLDKATPQKYIASYPDALIPAKIVFQDGSFITFHISQPTSLIHYIVIKFNGHIFIAPPFPETGARKAASINRSQ